MFNPQCVAAIRAVCEIYDRLPMSESASLAYFQATGLTDEKVFIQALFDCLKIFSEFPYPCDIRALVNGLANEALFNA